MAGYFEKWKEIYLKALEIDPEDYITNFNLGILYYTEYNETRI